MKHIKCKSILAAASLMIVSVFGVTRAFADVPKTTVQVSPMSQRLVLVPGETIETSIKVSNPNDAERNLDYSVSVGSFSQHEADGSKDDYGGVDTETVTVYNQIMDWIALEKTSGSVAPNGTDVIPFRITVPTDVPAGGQYATIIVKDNTQYANNDGNVSIRSVAQIASIIYAEVAGETRNTGEIKENNITGFLMNNTLEATSMVKNTGNVHTNASYVLQVWPMFSDEEICTNEEEPGESLVMPETERYHTESCKLPTVGIFRAKQTVKIFGETSIVEKTIIVCPIWLLFIIIFVVFALIFYFVARAKARKKATRSKSSQN